MTNSVSFLQSSVPKHDLIVDEYSCHDILSFTESWLKPDISTDSLKLPGYKPPYRINMVIRLLMFDDKDSALLKLLGDSDATLAPGLISIPDIINKIHNTKNRYLHIKGVSINTIAFRLLLRRVCD
jgi:hypothetical protein